MIPKIKTGLIKTTDKADKMHDSDSETAQKAAGSMSDSPKPLWQATVLTLFPEMFPGPLGHSLAGKSLNDSIWTLKTLDIREFARDKHQTVDDAPLGGGVGYGVKTGCYRGRFVCRRIAAWPADLSVTSRAAYGSGASA